MTMDDKTNDVDPALLNILDLGARLRWARRQIAEQNKRLPAVDHNGVPLDPPASDSTSP
jgi:hypothetical protein